jgi:polyhydroxyalkanoate synthase
MTKTIPPANPFDLMLHASEGRLTGGLSPASAALAYLDWALHLANAPGKRSEILRAALARQMALAGYLSALAVDHTKEGAAPITPRPEDHRFDDPAWQQWPFAAYAQSFLATEQLWDELTKGIAGVSRHHLDLVNFGVRQWLDMMSPSNFLATNPEIIARTHETGGQNLVTGARHFFEDLMRETEGKPPEGAEQFRPGHEVAVTPGQVVYRNELIELIQYTPTTDKVHPEPILIVPAWIMKYYILDLSPKNSMVRYLVQQGHTVFMISWINPDEEERDFSLQTYVEKGLLAALDAVQAIVPGPKVHAVGYCIGGTLLSLAAALLGKTGQDRLESLTLFAAQIDFTEAGEILLFVDDSQVAFLKDMMAERGYLDAGEMAGAFEMLRANDLIWSRIVHDYLMGERRPLNDLMAWNADATRMPYQMHSQYLQKLFLDNDFSEGRFELGDVTVAPPDITTPIFAVGTEHDHVAPWHSVYKATLLTDVDVTFLLTSGGHNAGIVSEPGHPRRHYRIGDHCANSSFVPPKKWFNGTPEHEGSWWPAWQAWLAKRSGKPGPLPQMGREEAGYPPLCPAPGEYVLQR